MSAWLIVLIVVVVIVGWVILAYNGLVRLRNRVQNAWAQIDVQLKRRHDLIPNLVETVKGYMKYEQETLEKVIKARAAAMSAQGVAATAQAENELTSTLKSLFALVENYPELKANQNMLALQEELTTTENRIAFARQHYNDSVMTYNTAIETFPRNVIAGMFGFTRQELFSAPEGEREAVKVQF
ncbi:MAG: LemA family protein [bacterium]|nr:LemA family protein [bacterium]